ncbi:hypothetical protein Tco_0614849 [Tanacetum coccineum]
MGLIRRQPLMLLKIRRQMLLRKAPDVVKENPKDVTDKAPTVDVVKDRALDVVKDVNRLDYDISKSVRKGMLSGSPRSSIGHVVKSVVDKPKDGTDKAPAVDVVKDTASDVIKKGVGCC